MGMFSEVKDPVTGRAFQIKTGYDHMAVYDLGDPFPGNMVEGVYQGFWLGPPTITDDEYKYSDKDYRWIVIKNGRIHALLPCTSEMSNEEYREVHERFFGSESAEKADRAETGPMEFGADWPGVFIRGDNAGYYAVRLANFFHQCHEKGITIPSGLLSLELVLQSCVINNGKEPANPQKMRPFDECELPKT